MKERYKCNIVFHCRLEMERLFRSCEGIDRLIYKDGEAVENVTGCAYVGSLPYILNIELSNLPNETPYLQPTQESADKWNAYFAELRLREPTKKFRIGLANSGNPKNAMNRFRTVPIEDIKALISSFPEAEFYCIQKGNEELSSLPMDNLTDLSKEIDDFDDTAALVQNLDLVISVDTSVIHVAGALNKKAFLLLSKAGDWRWLTERSDSPWYPSVQVFRQQTLFQWQDAMEQLTNELRKLLHQNLYQNLP
jgi:hypothetical protein